MPDCRHATLLATCQRALWALALACALAGCANFHLPRIDPTGERLFVPCNEPTPPPPGAPGVPTVGIPPALVGQWGISVSPSQVIAPVGSEVIMIASVAGPEGYLLTRERVEWMLAAEDVGQFVSPGKRHWYELLQLVHGVPKKVDNRFVINSTMSGSMKLDRGTPTPTDDVLVQSGQSWVTVTSPVEGTSHITVFAPGIKAWDRRQQTATIYWVDAQWRFPAPAITQVGAPHGLVTTVTRQSDNSPLVGWLVRYEVVGGPAAGFAPEGASSVEVVTGPNGEAVAELVQTQPVAGTNQINIQVIRPPGPAGQTRPLPLGAGSVLHTWSTTPAAPSTVVAPPTSLEPPPAQVPPAQAPPAQPPVAEAPPVQTAPETVPAELEVSILGPDAAQVGSNVHYEIQVINRGAGPARGLVVTDRFDDGLQHAKATGAIEKDLADLPPGGIAQISVDFQAVRGGESCQEVTVQGAGSLNATARRCVTISEPPQTEPPAAEPPLATEPPAETQPPAAEPPAEAPQSRAVPGGGVLSIRKTGPDRKQVGETALFTIEVTNEGQQAVENIEIADNFETSLQPLRATEGSTTLKGNTLGWKIDRLEPGRSLRRAVEFTCLRETPRACNRVTVTATGMEPIADEACLEIVGVEGAAPAPPSEAAAAPLSVTVADTADPIRVKEGTTYQILVSNKSGASLFDVEVTVTYTSELTVETFNGPVRATVSPGTLRFLPIREFRAGETPLTFELRGLGARAGKAKVQVSVVTRDHKQPVTAEQTTEVLDAGGN